MPDSVQRPFTVAQACEFLQLARPTLYGLARSGEIRMVKIGRSTRIPAADIYRLAGIEDSI